MIAAVAGVPNGNRTTGNPSSDKMINAAVNALLGSVIGIIALLLTAGLLMTIVNMLVWA